MGASKIVFNSNFGVQRCLCWTPKILFCIQLQDFETKVGQIQFFFLYSSTTYCELISFFSLSNLTHSVAARSSLYDLNMVTAIVLTVSQRLSKVTGLCYVFEIAVRELFLRRSQRGLNSRT